MKFEFWILLQPFVHTASFPSYPAHEHTHVYWVYCVYTKYLTLSNSLCSHVTSLISLIENFVYSFRFICTKHEKNKYWTLIWHRCILRTLASLYLCWVLKYYFLTRWDFKILLISQQGNTDPFPVELFSGWISGLFTYSAVSPMTERVNTEPRMQSEKPRQDMSRCNPDKINLLPSSAVHYRKSSAVHYGKLRATDTADNSNNFVEVLGL